MESLVMYPHSNTNSESTSWVLTMSMKGLDGYFPNMQFELSSVSLSVHRSARSGSGAENCIVNRARAGADAHFSGLGQCWAVHCVQLLESGARLLPAAAARRARWHVHVRLTVSRHRRHGWQEEPGKEEGTGFLLSLQKSKLS